MLILTRTRKSCGLEHIIVIIISSLPKGRSLASKFSNSLGFQPSSSYPHVSHLTHHRSCPFLAFPLVSFLPFSLLFLFSFMELSTCSFVLLSIQLTFPILLHTHISKAFK